MGMNDTNGSGDMGLSSANARDQLASKARFEPESITSYLHTVGSATNIDGTLATCRTHWVPVDPHGRPRVNQLATRLADAIVDYCIPRSKGQEALEAQLRTGAKTKESQLKREAKKLFSNLEKSGEGGELLLYLLLESLLGIPQILCKMSLKTNSNMHFHGVDGVHAQLLENDNLAIYWGESKMHGDFSGALSACFSSIAPFLHDTGGGPLERDLILARDGIDLADRELSLRIAKYFDNDEPESFRAEMRGACLIGFTKADYSSPFEEDGSTVTAEVQALLDGWMEQIGRRVRGQSVDKFQMEVFCIPVPSADEFREQVRFAVVGS